MNVDTTLDQRKKHIIQKWFKSVVDTYPPETSRLLTKETNQFANPVGHTIYHALQAVFDEFRQGMDAEKISHHLDRIIRIRAIQDFTPAQALGFVFRLKGIVREEMEEELRESRIAPGDLEAFDARVDEMALLAFNIYSECRNRLHEVRINELKNRTTRLLQKADLLGEVPEWQSKRGVKHQKPNS